MAIGINLGDDCCREDIEDHIPINERIKYLNPKAKSLIDIVQTAESVCPGFYDYLINFIKIELLKK